MLEQACLFSLQIQSFVFYFNFEMMLNSKCVPVCEAQESFNFVLNSYFGLFTVLNHNHCTEETRAFDPGFLNQ